MIAEQGLLTLPEIDDESKPPVCKDWGLLFFHGVPEQCLPTLPESEFSTTRTISPQGAKSRRFC
jgi:hypothetical protein